MTPGTLTDDEIVASLQSEDQRLINDVTAKLLEQWRSIVVNQVKIYQGDVQKDVVPVLNLALADFVRNVQLGIYQRGQSSPATYFCRIVRNRLLNRLRRDHTWYSRHGNFELAPGQLPSRDTDAIKLMESEENRKKMKDAILKLDAPCQKVLFDFWWEGKSLKEIAEELGKSWDATKQKHHRCLEHLRKILEEEGKDWFNE